MASDYLEKILNAQVYDAAVETPLDFLPALSARIGNTLLLKREDMQPVFSFKLRGAYNKIARLSLERLKRGQKPHQYLLAQPLSAYAESLRAIYTSLQLSNVDDPPQVALVTGEERIIPPGARYFLCTAESMVTDRAFPFVAIDEGQMGGDPERGHVFTNAMLHLRGTAETLSRSIGMPSLSAQ